MRHLIAILAMVLTGVAVAAGSPPLTEAEVFNWHILTNADAMRGTSETTAVAMSVNAVKLGFPYQDEDGSRLILTVNQGGKPHVYLSVSPGMFDRSDRYAMLAIKIDNEPVENTELFVGTSDDTGTFWGKGGDASEIRRRVMAAHRLVIEVPLYKEGRRQFKFNLAPASLAAFDHSSASDIVSPSSGERSAQSSRIDAACFSNCRANGGTDAACRRDCPN